KRHGGKLDFRTCCCASGEKKQRLCKADPGIMMGYSLGIEHTGRVLPIFASDLQNSLSKHLGNLQPERGQNNRTVCTNEPLPSPHYATASIVAASPLVHSCGI